MTPSRSIIMALQAAARRVQREGGSAEAITAWVQEALASPAPRRGRKPGSVRKAPSAKARGRQTGPDLAWRETIAYGSRVLRMTDVAMALELGVTRDWIRQIRNKTGTPIVRCPCGARARQGGKCRICRNKERVQATWRECREACGRRTKRPDGRCFRCFRKVRYKEDPAFKAKHDATVKRSRSRSPEAVARRREQNRRSCAAYKARRLAAAQAARLVDPWQPEAGR